MERVKRTAILYIDMIANVDAIDITTYDGVEPYAASFAHHHITDDACTLSDEGVLSELRRKAPHGDDASCWILVCHTD